MPLISKAETVTVVYDSNASSIRNGYYTATLSNGTVIGFSVSSSVATFQGAISQKTSVSIPDTIVYTNNNSNTYKFPVRYIGYSNSGSTLDFDNAQSVTSLTLPATITNLYVMAPNIKTLHTKSYISNVSTNSLSELTKVLVPSSTLSSYYGNPYWYNYVLINAEGTNPLKITINMTNPGEFAQLLLQKTDDWFKVNELTVTGELNTDDLNVFKRMRQLTKLDLSGATITDIPASFGYEYKNGTYGFGILETLKLPSINSIGKQAFQYCYKLKNVTINGVTSIGEQAFQYCSKLQNITLPNGLTSIGSSAFSNTGLKSINIPNSITSISSSCFNNCTELTSATIPSSVEEIGSSAFQSTGLTTINLPGVRIINGSAFQNCKQLNQVTFGLNLWKMTGSPFNGCTALTEIDLPAFLLEVNSGAFSNCSGIKKVICRAATAPTHGNNGNPLLYGCDMTNVKLYVPAMSIDKYRAQNGWKTFYTILPIEEKLTDVYIYDDETIDDASLFASNCDFVLFWENQYRNGSSQSQYYCGAVDYNGTTTFSIGNYAQYHYMGYSNNNDPYTYNAHHTSLIANGTMRANSVKTSLQTYSNRTWYFISFPYDVKVSDISYPEGTQFVIRKYSGLNRANQSGNTWQNLTVDSVMHAYEGYILKCNNNEYADFVFPAINNSNKNKVFEKGDVIVPLGRYPSEFEHNSSWNLIGNPYPCYYDTRFMDFTAPISVWNRYNSRYDAYSPVDDSFILHPAQAFFVQCPVNKSNITFDKEGRQKYATVRSMNNAPRRIASNREIYNVYLQSGDNEDRTRFVFNDDASRSYELDKDASKLIADGNSSLLIYTVENGVKYAINERDLADGTVHLGFYAPEDGEYRLSLESNATETATLIDHENDIHSSMIGDYVFKAKAGYNDARFALVFGQSGIIEVDNDNIKIDVNDGLVSANVRCNVYTIDGRMVGTCDADNTINLAKGIYVISGNNVTRKIVVK